MSGKYFFAPVLAISLMLICAPCFGANLQIIDRIKKQYEDTTAFDANFEQTLSHKESGAEEKRKGRLQFQKPLLIHWQTQKPHEETLVVTEKEIWDYLPEEEVAYRYSPQMIQDSRNIIQVLTGQAALNRDFEVKENGRENGLLKLLLFPNEPTPQMVEAAIWVDPETGFIKRARIVDFYGNSNDVNFSRFSAKQAIPASVFKFSPPKGIEIEDRMNTANKELFK